MNYSKAFHTLYNAAKAATQALQKAELDNAIRILQSAIVRVNKMGRMESENSDPPLAPSLGEKNCFGNGKHAGIECCCDECDHYLTCFPNWKMP